MKNLVIVESPTKARTISKFLGSDYEIKSSMGHIMDLPKSILGVDVEHNFKPQYELLKDKKAVAQELKQGAKNADSIILATDPDREGEAIASHIAQMLQRTEDGKQKTDGGKTGKAEKTKNLNSDQSILSVTRPLKRIVFHEITKGAIEEALKNPRPIDENLVDAQTARRVLDRLVGYKLSPLLWQKVRRGLSAGRVQSVALRLIVEREREIEKFRSEQYWSVTALLVKDLADKENQALGTEFELIEINGNKIEISETFNLYDGQYKITKTVIGDEKSANEITESLKTKDFIVSDVIKKEVKRSPQPPFTTSTLQQESARRFGFSGKRTMSLAQKLYEEGFITYHRTDSLNVAQNALFALRKFISKEYGDKFLSQSPRFYKTKQKSAQEAHEAIRPTNVTTREPIVHSEMGRDYAKLYDLIWKRAVASQMADAIIDSTTVVVDSISSPQFSIVGLQNNVGQSLVSQSDKQITGRQESENSKQKTDNRDSYRLKASGSVLLFEGFLKVNPQALQDKKLPEFKVSEQLEAENILTQKHDTQPPPRYNDASLIKTLEEKDIGRPSTYATIISTIEARRYMERQEGRFTPTTVGIAVNDFLVENFADIDDIPFTAEMENELDSIANGEKEWTPMIKKFYDPFKNKLEEAKGSERVKIEVEKTEEKCEKCGAPMVIRIGKYGKFLSCSTFPKCSFSKPFIEETGLTCPKDGGKIIVRRTRKGKKFYGCSNYPKCDFAAWKLEDIKNYSPDAPKKSYKKKK